LNLKDRFKTVDGILALGLNQLSFAVKAAHEFGGKFSFCLENHWIIKSESSYLVFGAEDQVPNMQFTDLLTEESKMTSLYPIKVTGISVNGTMLDIPSYVWDMTDKGAGGMIVDSGTTVTHLVEQAFDKVIAAFEPSLSMYNKTKGNLDYCFNAPPFEEFDDTRVPRLALHFEGGAKLEPAVNGYIVDDSKGVKCLGFLRLPWPEMNILGNLLMQNHLWEFDLANKKVFIYAYIVTITSHNWVYHFVSVLGLLVLTFSVSGADILCMLLSLLDACLRSTQSFLIMGLTSSASSVPVGHEYGLLVRLAILFANTVRDPILRDVSANSSCELSWRIRLFRVESI
ncbi:hypothetical protein Gohar_013066, partial [Gossypium harknessii]|nr:hypothetical protein [Gossypium harknessii]